MISPPLTPSMLMRCALMPGVRPDLQLVLAEACDEFAQEMEISHHGWGWSPPCRTARAQNWRALADTLRAVAPLYADPPQPAPDRKALLRAYLRITSARLDGSALPADGLDLAMSRVEAALGQAWALDREVAS
jgi:hypothetical protein